MDIQVGEAEPKRVVFELFKNKVPLTAENFRCLCTGEKSTEKTKLHYKGNTFHRLIPKFMIQGGDIENNNGTGGCSIYGKKFNDEKVWLPHSTEGLLSMANSGVNTNGSQFFITYGKAEWLNGKHTIFGRVIQGFEHVKEIEEIKTGASDKPLTKVTIVDCGEVIEDIPVTELDLQRYSTTAEEVPEDSKREI